MVSGVVGGGGPKQDKNLPITSLNVFLPRFRPAFHPPLLPKNTTVEHAA